MAEPYFTLRKQYFTARQRNFTRSQERISPRNESPLRFLHIHAYVRLIVKIVAAGQAGYQHAVRGGIYVRCIHAAYALARAYRRAYLLFGLPQARMRGVYVDKLAIERWRTAFNLAHFTFNFNNIYLHANLIARFYRMAETHFINTCKHRSKTTIFLRV